MTAAERMVGLFPGAIGGLPADCPHQCGAVEALWHGTVLVVHGPGCAGMEDRVGAPVFTPQDVDDNE